MGEKCPFVRILEAGIPPDPALLFFTVLDADESDERGRFTVGLVHRRLSAGGGFGSHKEATWLTRSIAASSSPVALAH